MTHAGIRLDAVVAIAVGDRPWQTRYVSRGTVIVGPPCNGQPGCSWLSEGWGHEIATLAMIRRVVTTDGTVHEMPDGWTE